MTTNKPTNKNLSEVKLKMMFDGNVSYYGVNRQMKFAEYYDSADKFVEDYKNVGIPMVIKEGNARTLYYLLYSQYGGSTIRFSDINQFRYALFTNIFNKGGTWERKLEIQEVFRTMSEKELIAGGKALYNAAMNPSTAADDQQGTNTDDELDYINSQNVNKSFRSKLDAYEALTQVLRADVTSDFIQSFKPLFKSITTPERALRYEYQLYET